MQQLLVTGAFQQLWFTNTGVTIQGEIMKKVKSILAVVRIVRNYFIPPYLQLDYAN